MSSLLQPRQEIPETRPRAGSLPGLGANWEKLEDLSVHLLSSGFRRMLSSWFQGTDHSLSSVCVCACVWAHTCSLSCLHGLTQHFSISETRPVVQRSSKLQGQSEKPQKRDRVEDGRLMGMDPSLNGQEAFKNVLN